MNRDPTTLNAPWKPGQSGNPKGRPKGSRNKLAEDFLGDLQADWQENGKEALKSCRMESPSQYCKIVASLMPKELVIERPLSELTDDDLSIIVARLQSEIDGSQRAKGRARAETSAEPLKVLSTLQ